MHSQKKYQEGYAGDYEDHSVTSQLTILDLFIGFVNSGKWGAPGCVWWVPLSGFE